jgi:hypothetical protein
MSQGFGAAQRPKLEIAKTLTWKSTTKSFQYYDKEAKENIAVPLPIRFV